MEADAEAERVRRFSSRSAAKGRKAAATASRVAAQELSAAACAAVCAAACSPNVSATASSSLVSLEGPAVSTIAAAATTTTTTTATLSWATPHDLSNPVPEDDDDPDMPDWDMCPVIDSDQSDCEYNDNFSDELTEPPTQATAQPIVPAAPAAFTFAHSCRGSCGDATCSASAVALATATTAAAADAPAAAPAASSTKSAVNTKMPMPWSEVHHWREADHALAVTRHLRAMSFRKKALAWMMGEVLEGACDRCLLLPQEVVELMCGHSLCLSCMRQHVAQRDGGRGCPACGQRTTRPEHTWTRVKAQPTEELRLQRSQAWERDKRNPVTLVFTPSIVPLIDAPPAPASSHATATAAPASAATMPVSPAPTERSSTDAEVQDHLLALKQMKTKLMAQQSLFEAQESRIEELVVQLAEETIRTTVDHLITRIEDATHHTREMEEAIAAVTAAAVAAEVALEARIASLQQQVGGGNWLHAISSAKQAAARAQDKAAAAEADQAKLKELMALQQIGPRMRAKGRKLLDNVGSKAAAAAADLEAELATPAPAHAEDVGITERWVDGLCAYLEEQIFFAGKGSVARTKLIAQAVIQRPAMQRMLDRQDAKTRRLQRAMTAMIDSAAGVLGHLTAGSRGSRSREDHVRFEAIVAALVPDDAQDLDLIRAIAQLLGVHYEQIKRALEHRRTANEDGSAGAFSRATSVTHKQRKDYRGLGRCVAIDYWHKATRLDTNVGKKKRNREVNPITRQIFYREHWRHVQYDTDEQIAEDFFKSVDYQQYLADGGKAFSKDLFLQCKCFCISKSDFQECACPTCTLMRETLRGWNQQRAKWYRERDARGGAECSCGSCAKGSAYREASSSLGKLRAFVHAPCGKRSYPELAIQSGPKFNDSVAFYRRQCCRAPLPDDACPHRPAGTKAKELCAECGDCNHCGWGKSMPTCPIEHGEQEDAEWKEYRPRIEPDGKSYQDELVIVKGTRKQLMERLAKLFAEWSPHDWIDRWATHQRHMTYATFRDDEMCISTDFSAQSDHKAFCTRTCEHPARSNMDVFIVTHSPREVDGERIVTTDVWRIFSEAKGSALFHNQALDDIVTYYRERLRLKRVFVFSDGCRSQYKGKKNFARVAQFPSHMSGVQLVHRFAASHHFKGPHDAYGKDAKQLCRTAERNGKARLASTHDVYAFCATLLPRPRHQEGVTAEVLVAPLPAVPPHVLTPEERAEEARAAAAALERAPTDEARRRLSKRLVHAGLAVPAPAEPSPAGANVAMELAAQEEASQQEATTAAAAADADDVEAAVQQAGQQAVCDAEADADGDEALGDFVFDATGARVGAGHAAAEGSDGSDAEGSPPLVQVTAPAEGETGEPPHKKKRRARQRRILTQAPGMEAGAEGAMRIETEAPRGPRMFAASNYFWLYYAADGVQGLTKQVGINQGSGPHGSAARGEYHARLLDAADTDADSIAGSNTTYEFAGMHADQPELLYTRTYSCVCAACSQPSSVSVESSSCPLLSTVGRWRQETIHSAVNVAAQRKVILEAIREFQVTLHPNLLSLTHPPMLKPDSHIPALNSSQTQLNEPLCL